MPKSKGALCLVIIAWIGSAIASSKASADTAKGKLQHTQDVLQKFLCDVMASSQLMCVNDMATGKSQHK